VNYFKTIKAALDASFSGICRHQGVAETEAYRLIRQHLAAMSKEWFSGDSPSIEYENPLCRFAYLYCHTAVNANLCEYAIRSSEVDDFIESKLIDEEELRICAFGGGPGTELLAVSKHLLREQRSGHARLSFTLFDAVVEWSETWNVLEAQINAELRAKYGRFRNQPFSICKSFITHDMTTAYAYSNHASLFNQDLFIMNYVVSELVGDEDKFLKLVSLASTSAPSGSKFLVVDRDQNRIAETVPEMLSSAGLSCSQVKKSRSNMDLDERKDDLEPYTTKIGRYPRCQWGMDSGRGAFFVVGTKP